MPDVLMPKLSDSMEQGTILTWLKATGDRVEVGEEILEIETDKSTVTYAVEEAGTLSTLAEEGATVAVGELIARIGEAAPEPEPRSLPAALSAQAAPSSNGSHASTNGDGNGNGGRSTATPLARRVAAVHGVELDGLQGTGPLGRITRADVLRLAGLAADGPSQLPASTSARPRWAALSLEPAPEPAPEPAMPHSSASADAPLPAGSTRHEPSRRQQLIALRMAEANATVPQFQVQTEVVMDAALAFRGQLKSAAGERDLVPSLNDIIVKAAANALREHPLANGSYEDDGFILHDRVNVGVAVAADGALVVPVVFDADSKSLGQIAQETRLLAGRVRDGQVSPAELEGGTFTVSNLGMFGMTAITPMINRPQAAILGVGAIRETLARLDGEIVDRTLLTLTLSCDHRILYGADASRFLAHIRELLEVPMRLAL